MASVLYRCPFTSQMVQGWIADDSTPGGAFVGLECLACGRTHLVDPETERVLGAPDQDRTDD